MALDQGTTSSRCILFDRQGRVCSVAQKEYRQIYPQPGWVEHDPMDIWSTQVGVAGEALYKIGAQSEQIAAIGITNQRESTIVWDRQTGEPVYNAIVWQCRRTADYCAQLEQDGCGEMIRRKTGLPIDPYFSGTKIRWILENVPGARERAQRGELLFGTVDSWLIWRLSGKKVHVTDYSNASRTMLFDIHTLQWDPEILALLDIPASMLPQPKPSSWVYGHTNPRIFGGKIPIAGAAGDQQAALFGQACFAGGDAKNTYGTGCFLLMNTGERPVASQNGLITTVAWGLGDRVTYALEGSIFVGGAVVQWLRDEMKLVESAADTAYFASKVEDTGGVYLVPAFTGLGAPHWDPYARGAIVGITRGTGKNHIIRAALESIAYQVHDVLQAMEADSGMHLSQLKVDGGASQNDFLLQFQADVLARPICRPTCTETTALGAAYLAGLAVGYWKNEQEIVRNWQVQRSFYPAMEPERRQKLLTGWQRAVGRSLQWENKQQPKTKT